MRPPISPQILVNRPAIKPVDLDGKRILLTGASSGIGEAGAEQLAREGATVVVVARRQDLLDDGLVGQQLFAGEATRLAYMTDEAVEGRDAFLEKRPPDWSRFPRYF